MGGRRSKAWISYDSATRNLSVAVSAFVRDFPIVQRLSHIIDLREFLPERVRIGFSGSTGEQVAIHRIHSWDFVSTLEEAAVGNRTGERSIDQNRGRKRNRVALFSGLAILICFGVVFRKRIVGLIGRNWDDFEMDESMFEKGAGQPSKFSFKELARATDNFNERDNKLGEGGFGKVYKGQIGKLLLAVKRVSSRKSGQGMKEFAAEVKIISRLRHRNLVQLIGWCSEKKELLLVYEFLPNGSLDSHLFQLQKQESWLLNWEIRYKIAKGLASGLLYLHEEWEQCVVHRDIKSSNVMLDSNFNAKLGDFGLARLVDHEKGSQTTLLAGTMGYLAPECVVTGKASRETDVYSFGVVLLEIGMGRRPAVTVNGQEEVVVHLVEWGWDLYGDGTLMIEGPDPKLDREYDLAEMERLLMVGLWCAHPDSSSRPSVRQALQLLNFEAPLPVLPLNMPVATYGGSDHMTVGSSALSTWTTMADADLPRRQVSCNFNALDGKAPSPLGKFSSDVVTF